MQSMRPYEMSEKLGHILNSLSGMLETTLDDEILSMKQPVQEFDESSIIIDIYGDTKIANFLRYRVIKLRRPSQLTVLTMPSDVYNEMETTLSISSQNFQQFDRMRQHITMAVLMLNTVKNAVYSPKKNAYGYSENFWFLRLQYLVNGDCSSIAAACVSFVKESDPDGLAESSIMKIKTNSPVKNPDCYLSKILDGLHALASPSDRVTQNEDDGTRIQLDAAIDAMLMSEARIICSACPLMGQDMEIIVRNILRYWTTISITKRTSKPETRYQAMAGGDGDNVYTGRTIYGTPFCIYDTESYLREIKLFLVTCKKRSSGI